MLLENWMNDNKYMLQIILILSLLLTVSGCGSSISDDHDAEESTPVHSGSVTLSWSAPTTNSDGSPLTDLGGYIVHYGTSTGNYAYSSNIGNFTSTTISNLSPGIWYFAITTYDVHGNESAYSAELSSNVS